MPTIADPLFTAPAYGGDWNPEQWFDSPGADAILDADIAAMKEASIGLVTLAVFSWARLEPEEGRYDLDWLEAILDRLADEGIMVDLATGTASPPAWMAVNHPDSLPVDARGARLDFGSRQQYSPSSSTYRRAAVALATRMAERFGDHPAVLMWHVGNEYACHVRECFSQESRAAFRRWLAARYGDIDALNAAWGTDFWSQRYSSFEQIAPPAAMPSFANPSQVLDWRRFTSDQYLSLFQAEADAIRAHSDRPVTTNFMGAFPALDYRAWARCVDVVADDSYPDPADPAAAHEIAFAGDLMRGLGEGSPWILMEQAPSAIQWRTRNSPKRPGQFLLWSIARLAHGADAVLQFQVRQSARGAETFHSGMIPHAGAASRTWDEVVETGRALSRLAPVVGGRVEAGAAIVVDWESEWARSAAIGPANEGEEPVFAQARAWHRTLWEAGHQVDVVGPDDDLSGYRLIIVPGVFIDRPVLADALERAVAVGAQVLVTGPTGVVDENAGAVLGGYLGALRPLLGLAVADHAALTGPVAPLDGPSPALARMKAVGRITRAVGVPAAQIWGGLHADSPALDRALDRMGSPAPDLRFGMWAEEIVGFGERAEGEGARAWPVREGLPADVEVIASFDGRGGGADLAGRPAITRRRAPRGAGAAWYAACDLDALSRAALVDLLTAHARLTPTAPGLPDGVEAAKRGDFLFLLNHSDRAVELPGVIGTDLVSGAECTGHVVLAPRSAMVVR